VRGSIYHKHNKIIERKAKKGRRKIKIINRTVLITTIVIVNRKKRKKEKKKRIISNISIPGQKPF
jgi:hypothetical protein